MPKAQILLASVAGTLAALAAILQILSRRSRRVQRGLRDQIAAFVARDAASYLTTDATGEIGYQNRAASERFGKQIGCSLAQALGGTVANPSALVHRLQLSALALGAAREEIVTRRGHLRASVHRIGGDTGLLWRFEALSRRGAGEHLTALPGLTLSKSGALVAMNDALRVLAGDRAKSLERMFADLPLRAGDEHDLQTPDGPMRCLVAELPARGGRRELYLLPGANGARAPSADPTAFEALPIALVRLTASGQVLAANRAARGLLGDVEAETMLSDLVEGLGRPVDDWLGEALAGRAEKKPEVLRVSNPEREVFLQVTLARVSENGRAGLIAVLSDATQLKTLEAQFVQSQKMQAIGQLAGGVAHDFNNLLTAISGHCDLLLLRHDKSDADFADLTQIHQNSNRAASLVGQLLAFSRKQTLKPAVIDLRDTLADLTHLLNRLVGEKVRLTLRHDVALQPIRADKRQLEQVLMNLVVNARDAMPDGGEIRIDTETCTLAEPMVRDRASVPPGDYVIVRVTDEGTGIAPDKLSKIFEPFFTTKRPGEGTGLGLSTAYGIVKQTGGYIFVDSVMGVGTTFTLYFTAHDNVADVALPVAVPKPRPAATFSRNGDGVVLLVEDEAPVRAFASRALRMRGYTVIEADCAEDALAMLEDGSLAVDVFVTDVIMPGMDGPTWVREALKTRPNTRVIFVSGYAEDSFPGNQGRIPNSVFLPKPFSLSELTATVQDQIH